MEYWNNFVKTTFLILTLKHRYPLSSPLMIVPPPHPMTKLSVLPTVQHVSDTPTPTWAAPDRCVSNYDGELFVTPRKSIRYCMKKVLESLNQEKRVTFALNSAAAFTKVPHFPNYTSNHCSGKGITTIQ